MPSFKFVRAEAAIKTFLADTALEPSVWLDEAEKLLGLLEPHIAAVKEETGGE